MRFLGGLWMILLIWLVGRNSGSVVVYLETWAIIGSIAMMMVVVGIFVSLPFISWRYSVYEGDPTEEEAEVLLKSNMSMCASIGFIAGSLIGALLASAVIS